MKTIRMFGLLCLLPLVARAQTPQEYHVEGVVRAILSPTEIVVAHTDIPGFMPAMTMAFDLAAPLATGKIQVDDRIEGTLFQEGGKLVLKDLVVAKSGDGATSASSVATAPVIRLKEGDPVPAFALLDQNGDPHSIVTSGQYTILTFIFTRCPVPDFCPLMTSRMAALQHAVEAKKVQPPLQLLSVTIDPEFDRPNILLAYAQNFHAKPETWTHAWATPEETDRLVRAFRVYRERNGALLDHTLCTALIDPEGRIVRIWRGNQWTTDEVVAAVNAAASDPVANQ